jgi:hypothetical protein
MMETMLMVMVAAVLVRSNKDGTAMEVLLCLEILAQEVSPQS